MDEEISDKQQAVDRWFRRKSKNRKGFKGIRKKIKVKVPKKLGK